MTNNLITIEVKNKQGTSIVHSSRNFSSNILYAGDGLLLDELKITFTIRTASDISYLLSDQEELKHLLQVHQRCFLIGGVDVNAFRKDGE